MTTAVVERPHLDALQIAILLLAVFSAGVHASFVFRPDEPLWVRISFAGVTLGYLVLLAARYAPARLLIPFRLVARVLLLLLTLAVIVGYFVVGVFDTLGNITKAAEALLVILLVVEGLARR